MCRLVVGWMVSLCALPGMVFAAEGAGVKARPEIPWQQTKDLPVENVGKALGEPVVKALPPLAVPGQEAWVQPFWFRADGRKVHFCTLNLQTGAVKRHEVLPAHEIWQETVHQGKLYLGYNVPAFLAVYDPATDTFQNLGKVFDKAITVCRLVAGTDGTLLCAGANGSTEVAIYDPKTGQLTNYGSLSDAGHNYVYYAWHDGEHIYGACRGKQPWALISLNEKTRERKVLVETAVDNHMSVGGNIAKVTDAKTQQVTYYRLERGGAVRLDGPPPAAPRPDAPAAPKPEVLFDADTVYTEGRLTIYYRLPLDAAQGKPADRPATAAGAAEGATQLDAQGWKTAKVEMGLEEKRVTRILLFDDHTIVGTSGAYGPMFTYDIQKDEMRLLGLPSGNAYSIGKSGGKVYVSGYPSTWFDEVDLARPFTPKTALPGVKAVPPEVPEANPRRIAYLGNVKEMRSHQGVRMHTGPDGKVWVIGMRHRYFRGFRLAWYDPASGKYDKYEDGGQFNHLQVSWSCAINEGRQLAITTRVEPDDQSPGQPPAAAKIFIFDMERGKVACEYTPFPEEKALATIAQVEDGLLLGLVTEEAYPQPSRTLIYKFDLQKGQVTARREYAGVIAGVPALGGLPREGPGFEVGPDGAVWTLYRLGSVAGYPYLLVRIDPNDLTVRPVGRVGAGGQFVFVGRDLYLAGDVHLRWVRNVVPTVR